MNHLLAIIAVCAVFLSLFNTSSQKTDLKDMFGKIVKPDQTALRVAPPKGLYSVSSRPLQGIHNLVNESKI